MRNWVKSVLFMTEECSYLDRPVDFEKFKFKDGINDFEQLFLKDEISYDYSWLKKKKQVEKERKELNSLADKMGVEKGEDKDKLNRSVEELSSDSESEEDTKKAKKKEPEPPSTQKKQEPQKKKGDSPGFLDGAKKFFNW